MCFDYIIIVPVSTPGNVISYKLWLSVHTCRIILHICRIILHKRIGSYMYGQNPTYPAINHTYLSYHSYILRHIIHTYLSYHPTYLSSSYISVASFVHICRIIRTYFGYHLIYFGYHLIYFGYHLLYTVIIVNATVIIIQAHCV